MRHTKRSQHSLQELQTITPIEDAARLMALVPDTPDAECIDMPSVWWFPENRGNGGTGIDTYARGRQLCRRCPERLVCLEGALERGEVDGMWGGMDPDELQAEGRKRARERRKRRDG
jgi:hypothetical protein